MGLMIIISIMHVMFESCHILWKHLLLYKLYIYIINIYDREY